MERFGLAGLLAVVLPSLALAQRVEIGVFGGWFQQTPGTHTAYFTDGASLETVRDGGGTVGAHFSVLGRRFGMSASVLQARSMAAATTFVDAAGTAHQLPFPPLEVKSTFFVLQPLVRLPVLGLEANVAAGPSFAHTYTRPEGSDEGFQDADEWWSMALSLALRAHVSPRAAFEFRGGNMYRLDSDQDGNRNHWIVGVGVAWALQRE